VRLDCAASQLLSIGRANPDRVHGGVALRCLAAADLLQATGAQAQRVEIPDRRLSPSLQSMAIRSACQQLAALPLELFGQPLVSYAAAAARRALGLLESR
jgi:hypothetical protein